MKTPTLKEVKKHFKNAKIVECAYRSTDTEEFKEEKIFKSTGTSYWLKSQPSHICLWREEGGYTKIIEHKDMNTKQQLQDKINDLQKELDSFKEPEFKKGDWVYWKGNKKDYGVIEKLAYGDCYILEYTIRGEGAYDSCHKSNLRPATNKEVEEALIKEAKKRGFKEGVEYKNYLHSTGKINGSCWEFRNGILCQVANYNLHNIHYIMKDGKWAEIIEETKPTIAGYEIEIEGNWIKFGCNKYHKEYVNNLYTACNEIGVTGFIIEDNEVSIEQLKEIVDYIK